MSAHLAAKCGRSEPDWPKSGDQHGMIAVDPDLFNGFVDRSESGAGESIQNVRAAIG